MNRLFSIGVLCLSAAVLVGCEASAGVKPVDSSGTTAQGREVHEKTVTDQNGNVVEHEKTVQNP